jgi:hypothetical protein
MFSGGYSRDGGITGKFSSGISSTTDNSNNTVNGSDDKGMVKRAAENGLAFLFGEELAREMIGGWNAVGETVLGAGIVGAAYGGYKKFTSNQLDTKPNPANNPTKIPTDAPINSNIDNPNNSMEDSFKDIDNYNKKITDTQDLMKQEGAKLQSLEDRLNNPKSKLSTGDQSRLGEQILESKEKLNGYASQLDELELGKQNTIDSINSSDIDKKSNSFGAKAGLLGFGAGVLHSLASNGWNFGATADAVAGEVGASWNQFRQDVKQHGVIQATGNQIGDALVGENARVQANQAFASGNTMQGYLIAGAGLVDNAIGLGSQVMNMSASAVQSNLPGNTTYAQAFAQNQQSWAGGTSFADMVASSNVSSAASQALAGSYTAPAPSTFDTSVATGERHVTETVNAQKEAQTTSNEMIDTLEQGFNKIAEVLKK